MNKYVFDTDSSETAVHKQLEYLDGKIAKCKDYELDSLLRQKLELIEELPEKDAAIAAFFKEYGSRASIRSLFAERMLSSGDIAGAITLLQQNKADPDGGYQARLAGEKLIVIFEQSGDTERLIDELKDYVMTFRQNDLQYIGRLKEMLPEADWVELRETLLGKLGIYLKNQLLFSEGLSRRLLDSILEAGIVPEMNNYSEYLRNDYSDEIRDFYFEYLQESAKTGSDRNAYRRLMPYLNKLSDYPGGKELAKELAAEWRQTYSRRSAMMDELQKAGY